eukprot:GHVT01063611.1.p1 GENE.GHVT01063611.1~~GHVT01063611.1.p1  ORF type:complete len:414 (+),score=7.46 GHVT01063611.1:380-1621(+)
MRTLMILKTFFALRESSMFEYFVIDWKFAYLLYKLVDILRAYFGAAGRNTATSPAPILDENAIRRNFPLVYELLDETIDNGYPQILELDVLKKYITQGEDKGKAFDLRDEAALKRITVQATGSCSWRAEGIKYKKNEVYIDVIEHVNVLVSQKGQVLRADVKGQIIVKCLLSGMPECKFGMNDKVLMNRGTDQTATIPRTGESSIQSKPTKGMGVPAARGIELDDCRFHQCVRLSKFALERTITFVPPDGTFELMTYRITENINLPFRVFPLINERGRTRLECSVLVKATYSKSVSGANVVLRLPCPKNTARAQITSCSAGKAKYEAANGAVIWRIRRFPGESEHTLRCEIEMAQTVIESRWLRPPISMDFQVPMFTASGLCVRFLKVQEKSNYKPVKWIRYITKAGSYQRRL